jgi:aldehyde dehydrogenase (NAD+)
LLFAEVMEEAGFPEGVVNVVTCGRDNVGEVGDELVVNPLVAGISFTGSTPVGKSIAGKAGALLKKCCVELGGKDALIVLDDANVDHAVNAATFGSFFHSGQICMSVERIIVAQNLADEFTEKLTAKAASLKVGPSDDKSNVIGPLINARQADRVEAHIRDALAQGATATTGGTREDLFIPPTVLSGVTPQMSVWRDETFGPVAPVIAVAGEDAMVELANDSEYGLSAGIITDDRERGMRIAERLETGMAHINDSSVNDEFHAPFGGVKNSGLGRHGGHWAIETFTETRWITGANGHRQYPI